VRRISRDSDAGVRRVRFDAFLLTEISGRRAPRGVQAA
jgi:hypothetical protein